MKLSGDSVMGSGKDFLVCFYIQAKNLLPVQSQRDFLF